MAFTNYLLTTMTPLIMMTMLSQTWAAGLASTGRVMEVLETVPEVQDAPDARPLPADAEPAVAFDDVGFHYNGAANEPVLQDVSLLARPGQTVADPRRDRLGQVHARQPDPAFLRREGRAA